MLNRIIIIVILAILVNISFGENVAFAAGKKTKKKKESISQEKPKADNYIDNAFDIKSTSLPVNFNGNNIVALYNKLSKIAPPKDEFESTEAYRKRLQNKYPQETFSFVLEDKRVNLLSSYDPDEEKMNIKIEASKVMNYSAVRKIDRDRLENNSSLFKDKHTTIVTKHIDRDDKKYEAGNKLGARTVVTEYRATQYGIAISNSTNFGSDTAYSISIERNLTFKISPEEGRSLKNNLGVLFICKVNSFEDPPLYYFDSFFHVEPTMDSPIEISFSQKFVYVDLYQIWIYNKKTGQIYNRDIVMTIPEEDGKKDENKLSTI